MAAVNSESPILKWAMKMRGGKTGTFSLRYVRDFAKKKNAIFAPKVQTKFGKNATE